MAQPSNRLNMLRKVWGDRKYLKTLPKVTDYLILKAIDNYTGDLPTPDMCAMMSAMWHTLDAIHIGDDERIFWEMVNEQS